MRLLTLALAVALTACSTRRPPTEEISEGLPPWMTKGEEVRLAVAWDLVDSGNTLWALDIARQMRSEGFTTPELDLIQGICMRLDGVASEAERLLLVAQRRMSRDARPPAELCILYADLGRLDEAIGQCQRAVHLDEADAKAQNNLAFLLLSTEDLDGALAAAEQAVGLDGTEPRYRNNLGLIQAAMGNDDLAYRTFASTLPRAEAAYMVALAVERYQSFEDAAHVV